MSNIFAIFEDQLGKVVEGTFGAMFRSTVQPAELARAAGKEMTRSRKPSLGKTFVANVYFVFISPRDNETMGDLIPTIEGELETYLLAFARERDYSFVTRPIARFIVDEKLKRQGRFDIIGQQMTAEAIFDELGHVPGVTEDFEGSAESEPAYASTSEADFAPNPRPVADAWSGAPETPAIPPVPAVTPMPVPIADIPKADFDLDSSPAPRPNTEVVATPAPTTQPQLTRVGTLIVPDLGEVSLDPNRSYVTGRQSSCDLPVSDANISRQHAEFFWDGEGWSVRDLGSTNGTKVNEHKISGSVELHDGDHITLGISSIIYHETSRMV